MAIASLYPELTQDVEAAPRGSGQVAFFDLDRTLIDGYSILPFVREAVTSGLIGAGPLLAQVRTLVEHGRGPLGPLIEQLVRSLRGQREQALVALGERVFDFHLAARIMPEARTLVQAHRRAGHRVVIVTSATVYQAGPVAKALGIPPQDVLCTRLAVDGNGCLTGRWHLPGCWNAGKRIMARVWLRRHGGCLADCWFYSDSHEDEPLLERVGRPRVVNPSPRLAVRAAVEDWPALTFRGRRPGPESVVRTGLCLSGLYGSALAGAASLLRGHRWNEAVEDAVATWGRMALPLAGLRLRVTGEAHLNAARPAVVVFNHQSAIDGLVMARLLRRDFTTLCKQELADSPLFGPALRAAGMIFIDRKAGGFAQLRPALDALAAGRSVAVAPEGTRSVSTCPGPFKRGAFHLALRAGVPLVPVVIHNAGDALPRGGFLVRPGTTIEVSILPPVDPRALGEGDLQQHADALQRRYLQQLGFPLAEVPESLSPESHAPESHAPEVDDPILAQTYSLTG